MSSVTKLVVGLFVMLLDTIYFISILKTLLKFSQSHVTYVQPFQSGSDLGASSWVIDSNYIFRWACHESMHLEISCWVNVQLKL